MENWKIYIKDTGYKTSREIYISRKNHAGGLDFLQPDGSIFTYPYNSTINPKPIVELEPEMLQELADELSSIGYKPQKGFIEGKLEATTNHLEDMRKLVFENESLNKEQI